MKRTRSVAWSFCWFGILAVTFAACSNQGEGERCRMDNENEDCASGLTCQRIEGQESELCCPPPPRPATVPECINVAPVFDGGGTGGNTSDAQVSEAGPDVEQPEVGPDSEPDAPDAQDADTEDGTTQDAAQDGSDAEG